MLTDTQLAFVAHSLKGREVEVSIQRGDGRETVALPLPALIDELRLARDVTTELAEYIAHHDMCVWLEVNKCEDCRRLSTRVREALSEYAKLRASWPPGCAIEITGWMEGVKP